MLYYVLCLKEFIGLTYLFCLIRPDNTVRACTFPSCLNNIESVHFCDCFVEQCQEIKLNKFNLTPLVVLRCFWQAIVYLIFCYYSSLVRIWTVLMVMKRIVFYWKLVSGALLKLSFIKSKHCILFLMGWMVKSWFFIMLVNENSRIIELSIVIPHNRVILKKQWP